MKYFNEENFKNFRSERAEYMKSYYLYDFTHHEKNSRDININPNDKLVDGKAIVDLFKENAIFKQVKEDDGYIVDKWIVDEDFKRKCAENYDKNKFEELKERQEQIQNQIFDQVYYEKKQGKRLSETSALELLEKLDTTTFYETTASGFSNLRLKISSLAETPEELIEFKEKVDKEKPFIFNYGLLGNLKQMSEQLIHDNSHYNRFNSSVKTLLIDNFYENTRPSAQLHLMTTLATIDRKNVSDFLNDIVKDERLNNLDILKNNPEFLNNYIHLEGMFKNVSVYIKSDLSRKNSESELNKALLPITNLIRIGGLDFSEQRERFAREFAIFEGDIKSAGYSDHNQLMNSIDIRIDDAFYTREQKIENNTFEMIEKLLNEDSYRKSMPKELIAKISGNFPIMEVEEKQKIANLIYEQKEHSDFAKDMFKNRIVAEELKSINYMPDKKIHKVETSRKFKH